MNTRRLIVVLALVAVAAGGWLLARRLARPSPENVILITVDALRPDHLSCYGYPLGHSGNIARFADSALVFDNAFTTLPTTQPAISSIFTSRYPRSHNVRKNGIPLSDSAVTLAEILKKQGWTTAAFVSAFPLDRRFNLNQGFDDYHDSIGAQKGRPKSLKFESNAEQMTNAVGKWLKKHRERRHLFFWIHYFDPHAPYKPPQRFAGLASPGATPELRAYDGEIAFLDEQFGTLLKKLDRAGILKNSLIIMTSDHGEGFGEHGYNGHGWFLYDEVLRVAMIVKGPGIKPGRDAGLMQHVDLAPGILDYLGIPLSPDFEGQSWWGRREGKLPAREYVWAERRLPPIAVGDPSAYDEEPRAAEDKWTIRTLNEKLIWSSDGAIEFYDLKADPGEKHNLYNPGGSVDPRAARLLQAGTELRTKYESHALTPGKDMQLQDKDTRDRLKALGYVD